MGDMFYDRDGKGITLQQWAKHIESAEYKRVAETTLDDGTWISTVWLGINHRFGPGIPVIFETMVFRSQTDMQAVDMRRYSTEEDAYRGHHDMVALIQIQRTTEKAENA